MRHRIKNHQWCTEKAERKAYAHLIQYCKEPKSLDLEDAWHLLVEANGEHLELVCHCATVGGGSDREGKWDRWCGWAEACALSFSLLYDLPETFREPRLTQSSPFYHIRCLLGTYVFYFQTKGSRVLQGLREVTGESGGNLKYSEL